MRACLPPHLRNALTFFLHSARVIAFFSYSVTSSLPSFALERAIIDKEMRNGMYGAASYVVSNTLVQLPFVFFTGGLHDVLLFGASQNGPDGAFEVPPTWFPLRRT
jgi:hypothetical protein